DVFDLPRSLLRCFEKRRRPERGRAVYRDHAEVQALFDIGMTSPPIHAGAARGYGTRCALWPVPARMQAASSPIDIQKRNAAVSIAGWLDENACV
ncbi:hypothetical protein, partial [Xanthomonas citri]|uniref:hypothetical protein n=1 Tax=Xanthomonas citri TaxID=346 RepID=UPI001ED92E1E